MQPAILPVIRERLVARIDNGAVKLDPLVNVVDDMVGALAQLELDRDFRLGQLEIERQRVCLPDAAGARKNLPGGKKREEGAEDWRRKLRLPFHQIILVTAERRAGGVVDVVFDE